MKVRKFANTPIVEDIGNGILKFSLPQPFYADNNIYIIQAEEPALIDSGFSQNLGLLQAALQSVGLNLHKIKHIFYTHNHVDHISAALNIRFYSNARLYGMKGMAQGVGDYGEYMESFNRTIIRLLYKAIQDTKIRTEKVELERRNHREFMDSLVRTKKADPILKMDTELVQGDVVSLGDREVGFLHTPGHNSWHLTPYILGEGLYFTGDLVLENISAIFSELDGNLEEYHNSLERLLQIPIKRLFPAHGEEPQKPHHKIRLLKKTLSIMERGVIRRLKEKSYDLDQMVLESMGEKVQKSGFYVIALAVIHSILCKLQDQGHVHVNEIDPPYETYSWID
ncbi:MAG: MBL fold metallo-hydrolase [Spirochaetota bacterium]